MCPQVCVRVSVSGRVSMCLDVCPCVSVCVTVCVHVSVGYNNGNFWEILCSAHPSSSKKELRVTHICYLCLHFHSMCTPINKRFNIKTQEY
jgi:hypothetical protein